MRIIRLLALPLVAALVLAPRRAPAQVNVTIRLGTPVMVTNYAPDYYGDWRTSYRQWKPVTVYYYQGHYYPKSVRGSRPVMIYRRGNENFLPPQDQAWANRGDKRFNYKRAPTPDDYRQAAPPPQGNNGRGRGRGGM